MYKIESFQTLLVNTPALTEELEALLTPTDQANSTDIVALSLCYSAQNCDSFFVDSPSLITLGNGDTVCWFDHHAHTPLTSAQLTHIAKAWHLIARVHCDGLHDHLAAMYEKDGDTFTLHLTPSCAVLTKARLKDHYEDLQFSLYRELAVGIPPIDSHHAQIETMASAETFKKTVDFFTPPDLPFGEDLEIII